MAKSIYDVAIETGLSVSTVSRALNGYEDVAEHTRQRVKEASDRLGYVPNTSAKNLSSKNKKNVALIICGLMEEEQSNEFTMWIIQGAYSYMRNHGNNLAMYTIGKEEQERKDFDTLCREYSLSGAVIMGLKTTDAFVGKAPYATVPCVSIDIQLEGGHTAAVMTDDRTAFEQITQYVIDKGHRKLVLVSGRKRADVCVRRFQGFCDALGKNGLKLSDCRVIVTNFLEKTAYEKTKKLLEQYKADTGTAFICMSDLTAIGVLRAVEELGYESPKDFSITGYDGNYFMRYIQPFITRINQNMRQKGYDAARLLMKMVKKEKYQRVYLTRYALEEGKSVKKLN